MVTKKQNNAKLVPLAKNVVEAQKEFEAGFSDDAAKKYADALGDLVAESEAFSA